MAWKWNLLHRLMCLNSWSLAGGAVHGRCGIFRRDSLAGRNTSLGGTLGEFIASALCLLLKCDLSASFPGFLLRYPPHHYRVSLWTINQNRLPLVMVFHHSTDKSLTQIPRTYRKLDVETFICNPTDPTVRWRRGCGGRRCLGSTRTS